MPSHINTEVHPTTEKVVHWCSHCTADLTDAVEGTIKVAYNKGYATAIADVYRAMAQMGP